MNISQLRVRKGGRGEKLIHRLDALTRKEQNLNLFHALGKVLYNKREL